MFAKSSILDVYLGSEYASGIFILGNTLSRLFCLFGNEKKEKEEQLLSRFLKPNFKENN